MVSSDKAILYVGTDPTHYQGRGRVIHYPVIRLVPKPVSDPHIERCLCSLSVYTHILFTSKQAVSIFFSLVESYPEFSPRAYQYLSIGAATTHAIQSRGGLAIQQALVATQEGVIDLIEKIPHQEMVVLYPRSSQARPLLADFFAKQKIVHTICDLYDPCVQSSLPIPDLAEIDEIVFTSPSTVRGFLEIFAQVPDQIRLVAIGPITQRALQERLPFRKIDLA